MKLARALDDDMHTKQWHNIVDWLIIAMILLSTTEIFLSTFDLDPKLRKILFWVDIGTLAFFTVEVIARIWVAPEINPKYKGFKGRLKYCFSFYGMIDLLSTFPFYLQWLVPLPVGAFKMLRTARVVRTMRIGRYSKSFNLLSNAIKEKRRELIVSMQFLVLITLILSLILFFAEHEEQPDVYKNGFISVIWAFAQYIGDPGQFADTPPITGIGRIIACIVGLLGIAIVAVPAGIIGAGFTEALEKEAKKDEVFANSNKLHAAFQRKLDKPTGYQICKPFLSTMYLQSRLGMKNDEMIDAVNSPTAPNFRLVSTASTIPAEKKPTDMIAVEHFVLNTPYGLCIDRNSPITIVSPSSMIDPGIGNFSFYVALLGGFNYISREVGERCPYQSVFITTDDDPAPEYEDFAADVARLCGRKGSWSVTMLTSSGANEPIYPTQLHFGIGGAKQTDDQIIDDPKNMVKDIDAYRRLFAAVNETLGERFAYSADHQRYYTTANPRIIYRRLGLDQANHIVLRIEWEKLLWDPNRILFAKTLAALLSKELTGKDIAENPVLKQKNIGYEGY